MSNIFKFQKPTNQDKKLDSPWVVRVLVITLILLAIVKILGLDDARPSIYRHHGVYMLQTPLKIPEDILVYDLAGRKLKLSELLGSKVTIIAFWATWCSYCAEEFPQMDNLVPYLEKHNVKIIPIARGDDTPVKVQQFFERDNVVNLKSVIAESSELYKILGIKGYPWFIAVDENGMAFASLHPKWDASDIFDLFEKLGASKNQDK